MGAQAALSEYNFEVRNVVDDLQDGIRLCRLAQLMSHDFSILEVGALMLIYSLSPFLVPTLPSSIFLDTHSWYTVCVSISSSAIVLYGDPLHVCLWMDIGD